MRCCFRCTSLATAFAAIGAHTALAQEGSKAESTPERCISLLSLERTDVVDDRTIIFHMRNGRMYLNHLSRECPGLAREKRFMYSPTSTKLCEVDAVTVIEEWGFGFTRGFTCSLGPFQPISQSEYESLLTPVETEELTQAPSEPAESAPTADDPGGDTAPSRSAELERKAASAGDAAGNTPVDHR
jgi:hypothetical protein